MKWTKQKQLEPVIDDLEQDARLMWVGPRETEHVIIYCHGPLVFLCVPKLLLCFLEGGGFVGPLSDFQVEFWYRVQQGLRQTKNLKVGVAILQYCESCRLRRSAPIDQQPAFL